MKKIVNLNQKLNSEYQKEEIINCKLCQQEIVIYSEVRRLNVRFYDSLTSYNFCSARCFNQRSETYREWMETEEDTD